MDVDDLALSLHRHATSKLTNDDILKVLTLGYRGEALPSIATVADVSIISRTAEMDCAFMVRSCHGDLQAPRPSAGQYGTIVEVLDLFARHPARQKFQKSAKTEAAAIREVLAAIALCFPSVDFRFSVNGTEGRYQARESIKDRCADVLGKDFQGNGIEVAHQMGDIRIDGVTCIPTAARSDASGIRLSVNGRPIADKMLKAAVQAAYASLIGPGRHPQAYIAITLPSNLVDINVHPRKAEVRFMRPSDVATAVRQAVEHALDHSGLRSPISLPDLARTLASENEIGVDDRRRLPLGQFVGQTNGSWLISETADGIVIIDQHAAHERVILERLKQHMDGVTIPAFVYPEPVSIDVSFSDATCVDEAAEVYADLGFKTRVAGEVVQLIAVPSVLADVSPKSLVTLVVRCAVDGVGAGVLKEALWEKLATAACKAAIKAGDDLTPERADLLLREIEATPNASYCNHGRPTVAFLKNEDIAKLFARG
jgi:DNA mismatch repair protein MutL